MQGEEQFCHMDLTECIMEQVDLLYLLISMSGDFYADRQTDKHTQMDRTDYFTLCCACVQGVFITTSPQQLVFSKRQCVIMCEYLCQYICVTLIHVYMCENVTQYHSNGVPMAKRVLRVLEHPWDNNQLSSSVINTREMHSIVGRA